MCKGPRAGCNSGTSEHVCMDYCGFLCTLSAGMGSDAEAVEPIYGVLFSMPVWTLMGKVKLESVHMNMSHYTMDKTR